MRHRITRMCMLSDHSKCVGFFEVKLEVTGTTMFPCDCACHESLPTLWSDDESPSTE